MREEQLCGYRVIQDVQRGKSREPGRLVLIRVLLRHEVSGRGPHTRGRSFHRFR
jgi:hypothetical protein